MPYAFAFSENQAPLSISDSDFARDFVTYYLERSINSFMYYPDAGTKWHWYKTVKQFDTWTNDPVNEEDVPTQYKAQLLLLT